MKTLSLFLLIGLLCGLPLIAAQAQSPSAAIFIDWIDYSRFPEVSIHLSAWDASGLPLSGLAAGQFTLQEDGGASFQADALSEDNQAPVWVALVIDVSGSMGGQPLDDAQDAAARFLDKLQPGRDQVALLAFSDPLAPQGLDPQRELAFSTDLTPAYDLIEGLQASGQTQLYNAAAKAVGLFAGLPPGNRAILLLSDGRNEPAEVGEPAQAIELARQAHVPFFVVGLGNQIDLPYLQRLTGQTGGLFRAAPRSSELAQLYSEMAAVLKTEYTLSYTSNLPADGLGHTLKVQFNGPHGSAEAGLDFGPLPLIPPTNIPATQTSLPPSPTAVPSATPLLLPTHTPIPAPTATASSPPPPSGIQIVLQFILASPINIILTLAIGGGSLALILRLLMRLMQGSQPKPGGEACAKCGYDLTGKTGACPQCGETRRLPKP